MGVAKVSLFIDLANQEYGLEQAQSQALKERSDLKVNAYKLENCNKALFDELSYSDSDSDAY